VYRSYWASGAALPTTFRLIQPLLRAVLWPIRYRSVLAFTPPNGRRVFEFGAAKATDLLTFRAAGWEVAGCEPSADACARAALDGIHLQQTTAERAVLPDGGYDCLLFNNVFEHVHDPVEVLRKCHRALTPGGILMLIVPNHASFTSRVFGGAWPGYDAPRHTWGWTPAALDRQLAATGFAIDYISYQSTGLWMWRSTLDMRNSAARPGRFRLWLARRAPFVMLPWSFAAATLRHGDWIRVVARRP
jgi:SAM-dependent methyltransferase